MRTTHESQAQLPQEGALQFEYDFDYSKARPNRFAAQLAPGSRMVTLDPDLAEVFTTPEAVSNVLRALITTMPNTPH